MLGIVCNQIAGFLFSKSVQHIWMMTSWFCGCGRNLCVSRKPYVVLFSFFCLMVFVSS